MIPAAMKFSSRSSGLSGSSGFETLPVGNRDFQVHAVNRLYAGKGPEFEISGTGAFSFPEAQAKSNTGLQSAPAPKPAASAGARFILHSPASFDSGLQRPQPSSQLLVLLALTGGLVAICIFLAWHATSNKPPKLLGKWPAASGHNIRH
jgi:hypothetical protein